ncbi:NAD-dependent epimerase/dehydratase family protein [Candidatus Pelagibacter sp.]|nr:NAD-dependent epimerase/dehydratase family protein [Candidatus Pelagibacter sp.]
MNKEIVLITGVAGFIGFSLAQKVLKNKDIEIIGIDNLNSYYSKQLKLKRLNILKKCENFKFYNVDLVNKDKLNKIFKANKISTTINFAAQAGVRYSYENPRSYTDSNIIGFINLIEVIRNYKIKKFIFASSSSVYGDEKPFPKSEKSEVNPINLYSLSKLSNEQYAKSMSKSMITNIIGLRFFTIYGPWGRPDMMIMKYLIASKKDKDFLLFNRGDHFRDFTYIDDAINICEQLIYKKFKRKFDIFNICSSKPINILKVIKEINLYIKKPKIIKKPRDRADVYKTFGNNKKINNFLKKKIKFTDYKIGVKNTCDWFLKNYNSK